MSKEEEFEKIKRRWSKDDAPFYKELEAFMEKHRDADAIVHDAESGCPRHAIYGFAPYQSYVEGQILQVKLAIAMLEENETN